MRSISRKSLRRGLKFHVVTAPPIRMQEGAEIEYRLKIRGIPMRWRSRITVWDPPRRFVDEQLHGPYRLWIHEHRFTEDAGGTSCEDHVEYAPLGGALINKLMVERDVRQIFAYRAERLQEMYGLPRGGGAMAVSGGSDIGAWRLRKHRDCANRGVLAAVRGASGGVGRGRVGADGAAQFLQIRGRTNASELRLWLRAAAPPRSKSHAAARGGSGLLELFQSRDVAMPERHVALLLYAKALLVPVACQHRFAVEKLAEARIVEPIPSY